jgi:hypothetical protein
MWLATQVTWHKKRMSACNYTSESARAQDPLRRTETVIAHCESATVVAISGASVPVSAVLRGYSQVQNKFTQAHKLSHPRSLPSTPFSLPSSRAPCLSF